MLYSTIGHDVGKYVLHQLEVAEHKSAPRYLPQVAFKHDRGVFE